MFVIKFWFQPLKSRKAIAANTTDDVTGCASTGVCGVLALFDEQYTNHSIQVYIIACYRVPVMTQMSRLRVMSRVPFFAPAGSHLSNPFVHCFESTQRLFNGLITCVWHMQDIA